MVGRERFELSKALPTDLQSVPKQELSTLNTNILQDTIKSKVTKSCLNRVQNYQNSENKPTDNNQIAEAVLAINALPLSNDEKAEMVKLLMKKN